jgi:hypothetical protein
MHKGLRSTEIKQQIKCPEGAMMELPTRISDLDKQEQKQQDKKLID